VAGTVESNPVEDAADAGGGSMTTSGTLIGVWAVVLAAGSARAGVRSAVTAVPSGRDRVTVEWAAPDAPGRYPLVVLLHGSGGLEQATGDVFRTIATHLAEKGYVVLIPHYFDRRGRQPEWVETVGDVIKAASTRPDVDPDRVGLFGFSLGSYLAFFQGARDKRVKAVVSVSGSLPLHSKSKFPPSLLLHGSGDKSTPPRILREFTGELKAKETPYAVHVYPGERHNFSVPVFLDAGLRAGLFFDVHLRDAGSNASPGPPSPEPEGRRDLLRADEPPVGEAPPDDAGPDSVSPGRAPRRRGGARRSARGAQLVLAARRVHGFGHRAAPRGRAQGQGDVSRDGLARVFAEAHSPITGPML
jgi:carboxymethylenebutenolidase